jgi:hypothetical protein
MVATAETTTTEVARCVSCDAALSGAYCSQCGERVLEPRDLTLRHFLAHTVANELFSLDGALFRTLRLLFMRPGRLSLEYAAGRRRPYLNPFRLLLIAIVAYALISTGRVMTLNAGPVTVSMAPELARRGGSVEGTIDSIDRYKLLEQQVIAKQQRLTSAAARERFHDRLTAFAQPASFTIVILLAAVLHLAFRWRRRRFLEHAAFSMHVFSFVLLSSAMLSVAFRLRDWLPVGFFLMIGLVSLWQFAYLAVAIRRFYVAGGRWGSRLLSVAAAMLIYVLNTAFISAVQLAGAAIALALS